MPEQLALDQGRGDGAAVERDERLAGAAGEAVDRARGDLLAAAGGPGDQHGRVGAGDAADDVEDLGHRLGAPDEVAEASGLLQLRPQCLDFGLQAAAVGEPVEDDLELRRAQGLEEIVERAGPQRLDRVVDRALAGDHDPFPVRLGLARGPEDLDAVAVGQVDVHDEDTRIELFHRLGRFAGGADGPGLAAEVADGLFESFARGEVVFDDEDFQGVVSSGSSRDAETPSSPWASRTAPPASAAYNRAVARPIPQFFPWEAARGEKSFSGSSAGRRPALRIVTRSDGPSRSRRTVTPSTPPASALAASSRNAWDSAVRSPVIRPPVEPVTGMSRWSDQTIPSTHGSNGNVAGSSAT